MKVEIRPIPNGLMVWWEKQENAAQYSVKLFIGMVKKIQVQGGYNSEGDFDEAKRGETLRETPEYYQPLCIVEKDRQTFYHTFTGLAANIDMAYGDGRFKSAYNNSCNGVIRTNYRYFIQVEAEDREGNILTASEKLVCNVEK